MTRVYSEKETISAVMRLTRTRLSGYVQAELVSPMQSPTGLVFTKVDLARLELICDLSEQFDLEADALGVVLSLVDQLHGVRVELRALTRAIEAEPEEVRARIIAALTGV